jgi:hypothetical protein
LAAFQLLSTSGFELTLSGVACQTYNVQASTDLLNWIELTNLAVTAGPRLFLDQAATGLSRRSYRAVSP